VVNQRFRWKEKDFLLLDKRVKPSNMDEIINQNFR